MAVRRMAWAGTVAAMLGMAGMAQADSILPAAWYVKPDQTLTVGFYSGPSQAVHRGETAAGLKEAKPAEALTGADGAPAFTLYTMAGKKVDPKQGAAVGDATKVDLDAIYPALRAGGTYILVWKDAQPLVLENLYNPGQGATDLAKFKDELGGLGDVERNKILLRFAPTVLHVVPLEYADIKTEKGEMKATFAYDKAPHTIDNYVTLADQNFYDGGVFHRIMKGFMVQGGDSTGNVEGRAGTGGPGYQVMAEFSDKQHERGVLSMARSSDANSAGSQFFIMDRKNSQLDGSYTAFGQVISGMEAVDELVKTPVSDSPGPVPGPRSAESRVGKECRSRWSPYH